MSNVKFMTLSQLKRIRDAGYVGEHAKRTKWQRVGKQKDYHDQRNEIDARIWEMEDKAMVDLVKKQCDVYVTKEHVTTEHTTQNNTVGVNLNDFLIDDMTAPEITRHEIKHYTEKAFNPWKWLGSRLIEADLIDNWKQM